MKKEKVYLDTSVISAYFDNKLKSRQKDTKKFWKKVVPLYEIYISTITVQELNKTKTLALRRKFKGLIKRFKVLRISNRVKRLAKRYIEEGIFPEKYSDDALHVAVASYYKMSYLVSWNFEHIVKVRTRRLVNSVNALNNFNEIEIVSPLEL